MFNITLGQVESIEHQLDKLRVHFDTNISISSEEKDMGIRVITKIQGIMNEVRQTECASPQPKRIISKKVQPQIISEDVQQLNHDVDALHVEVEALDKELVTQTIKYTHLVENAIRIIERATTQDELIEVWNNDGMLASNDKLFFEALGKALGIDGDSNDSNDILNKLLSQREAEPTDEIEAETTLRELTSEALNYIEAETDIGTLLTWQAMHVGLSQHALGIEVRIAVETTQYVDFVTLIASEIVEDLSRVAFHQNMNVEISKRISQLIK